MKDCSSISVSSAFRLALSIGLGARQLSLTLAALALGLVFAGRGSLARASLSLPRIFDAPVEHVDERIGHLGRERTNVLEREAALVELAALELGEDHALNHLLELHALRRLDGAARRFDRVDEHQDGGLF